MINYGNQSFFQEKDEKSCQNFWSIQKNFVPLHQEIIIKPFKDSSFNLYNK